MLLDNGRSNMVGSEFQDMLRCIRCGACMNHCPVYQAVGGHAYGWVYPGPMGAVLTPSLIGVEKGGQLPNASTFCGRCEEVCPVRIPLPKLMRHWREREFEKRLTPAAVRTGLGVWAWLVARPRLYRLATRLGIGALRVMAGGGASSARCRWRAAGPGERDFPAPQGRTFMDQWKAGAAVSARERILGRVRAPPAGRDRAGGGGGGAAGGASRRAGAAAGEKPGGGAAHPVHGQGGGGGGDGEPGVGDRGAAEGAGARAPQPQPAGGGALRRRADVPGARLGDDRDLARDRAGSRSRRR